MSRLMMERRYSRETRRPAAGRNSEKKAWRKRSGCMRRGRWRDAAEGGGGGGGGEEGGDGSEDVVVGGGGFVDDEDVGGAGGGGFVAVGDGLDFGAVGEADLVGSTAFEGLIGDEGEVAGFVEEE